MNVKELYDHILKHMSAEDALMKLLEGQVTKYEFLKFEGDEGVHPIIVITMATHEMGWNLAFSNENEVVNGMVIGTPEYINEIFPDKNNQ